MPRVTQSNGGDYETPEWNEDTLYPVRLKEIRNIFPKGSTDTKGQVRKNAAAAVVWETEDSYEAWVFDTIGLTVNSHGGGIPSKCLQLTCALANKDPHQPGEPWIDPATLEFGFSQPGGIPNEANWPVEGRIALGDRVQIRGRVSHGTDGRTFLNPDRYRPAVGAGVQEAARQVATVGADMQLSPDGQWAWTGSAWIPNPARG